MVGRVNMSKTPEELAEEHANLRCPEQGAEFIVWCMCRDDFLAGYTAAQDQYREAVKVLGKHKAAVEKAVTNIKNASDWVTVERGEDE